MRNDSIRTVALLARLRAGGTLLADGATGTMLHGVGLDAGQAPELWVLEQPDRIRALHQSYVDAGSDMLLTCTFGGTRYRLESHGLAGRVIEVNRRAAELAREIAREFAGDRVFVVGDMGPTGQLLQPLGPLTPQEVADAYAEQATGLAEGGVDLLLIETMSDLGEAEAAIDGARRVSDLPIACTFSFDTHGRTMMGLRPETVAQRIGPQVEIVGTNCGRDPAEYPAIIRAMRNALKQVAPRTILWAKPNAGLPRLVDDTVTYDATPEQMGQITLELRRAGAQVFGGCCGTTPAHLAAMAGALRSKDDT
jgi:5-methyltetrahydrofolate--homocysteine methyltransferase